MTYPLYSGQTVAQVKDHVTLVAVINSSGTWLDDISNTTASGTLVTGASNLGTGLGVFSSVTSQSLTFNSLSGTGNVTAVNVGNTIIFSGTGNGLTGPGASTNNGITTWSGTTGLNFNSTPITIVSNLINFPSDTTSGTGILWNGDTNLYRNGIASLKTDSSLAVGAGISLNSSTSNASFNGNITYQGLTPFTSGTAFVGTVGVPIASGNINSVMQAALTTTSGINANSLNTNIFTNQSATIVIGLPVTPAGKEFRILSTVSSAINTVIVSGISCTIDGAATKTISSATVGASSYLISNGANYFSLSNLV